VCSQLPADFAVAYVGQLSRVVLDHDRGSKPLKVLLQSDVAPYTTHAYLVSRDGAALLANHLQFMLARAGSPHARAPFYMNADAPQQYPWALTALDVKIDFFMIETHRYMFSREGSLTRRPSWFTFESTKALPASFGRGGVRWAKNGDVQLGHANAGRCAADKPDYIPCEAALAAASPCGPSSRRLPIMGTGLAFQNQCRQQPFTLYAWAGSAKEAVPPTCAALRKRIAPNAASDPTPADCLDEGAVALQQRAVVPSAPEQGIQFSVPGSGMAPQPWDDLLKNTITAAGSPWIDRAKPPAVIVAHGMPCGRTGGRCDVPFSIRPGTTDSAVLGQVIARDEYGFLWKQHLPAPRIILDAGANCGIASVLFANLFPDATIVSVEPATDNFAALSTQIEPYASRIWAVNAALWGEHAALNVVKGARHGREWDNQIKADVAAADSKNAIAGNTVAELLQLHELPRFDFVKIDIEGSEKQVFEAQDLSWLDAASYVAVELHDDSAFPSLISRHACACTDQRAIHAATRQ
jgi:FkbM family methyltransferase